MKENSKGKKMTESEWTKTYFSRILFHVVIIEAYCYLAFQFCCGVSGINYSNLLERTKGN